MSTLLEERVAHLLRAMDDLSDVVARQDRAIAALERRVAFLLDRERAREEDGDAPVDRPPHY